MPEQRRDGFHDAARSTVHGATAFAERWFCTTHLEPNRVSFSVHAGQRFVDTAKQIYRTHGVLFFGGMSEQNRTQHYLNDMILLDMF